MGVRILSDRPCVYGLQHHKNCSCGGPIVIDANKMSATDIVDYLTYCNYKHNRLTQPDVTPEQWATVYGPTTLDMETRFQQQTDAFFRAEWAQREKAGAR